MTIVIQQKLSEWEQGKSEIEFMVGTDYLRNDLTFLFFIQFHPYPGLFF